MCAQFAKLICADRNVIATMPENWHGVLQIRRLQSHGKITHIGMAQSEQPHSQGGDDDGVVTDMASTRLSGGLQCLAIHIQL